MKKLVIEFSNERLIIPSGLSLVGIMLGKNDFAKKECPERIKVMMVMHQ